MEASSYSPELTPTDVKVVEVDPSTDRRWDEFVASHPDGLVYHHSAWLDALQREYPQERVLLACETGDGDLVGVLPLIRTRGLPLPLNLGGQVTTKRLSSLPRTPLAGPLGVDDRATAALVRAALDRVSAEPGIQLQLKPQPSHPGNAFDGLVSTPWRLTYVLPLRDRAEDIRFGSSRKHAQVKRAINKAHRVGVRVRPADSDEDLRAWYDLYLDTHRWNGVPARPYRLFAALWDLMLPRGLMQRLLAERQSAGRWRMIAGSVLVMLNRTVFYAFNGRRLDELGVRPNDAIHWRALQDACERGFRYYDFGEVESGNPGLAQYKSKWGTEAKPLSRYYYPGGPRVTRGVVKDRTSPVRTVATLAWRRFPLGLTRVAGDSLYRYL